MLIICSTCNSHGKIHGDIDTDTHKFTRQAYVLCNEVKSLMRDFLVILYFFLFSGRLRWKSGQRHQTLAEMFLQVAGSNPATAEIHDLWSAQHVIRTEKFMGTLTHTNSPNRLCAMGWNLFWWIFSCNFFVVHIIWTASQTTNLVLNVCFDFFSRHENQIWKL